MCSMTSFTLPPEGQSQPTGRRRDTISLEGLAARYPPGSPLGKPLPPLAFQNVGVGRRICYFSSFAKHIPANDNEEVAGGSEGPRCSSLLRQTPRLLRK